MNRPAGGDLSHVTQGVAASFVPVTHVPRSPLKTGTGSLAGKQVEVAVESKADQRPLADLSDQVENLAAIVELLTGISEGRNLSQASQLAADRIRSWLSADSVEIAWQKRAGEDCELVASSGFTNGAAKDDDVRLAAAEEIMTRGALTDSMAVSARDRVCLLAVKELVRVEHLNRVMGVSLLNHSSGSGTAAGSIMVSYSRMMPQKDVAGALAKLDACRVPIAQTLSMISEREPVWWEKGVRELTSKFSGNRRKWFAFLALFLAGLSAIPLPYKVSAKCVLQPTHRRFISSPMAGTLHEALAIPGDVVAENQLLAKIDPREIEIELQGRRADFMRADRERKGLLAQHKIAESKLLQLQVQRLGAEVTLLENRLAKLAIRSPIEGTIVTGDWKRAEGTLLEKGEMLFEVAPLGEFFIELEIDESDLLCVRKGMPLSVRLDALPTQVFEASVFNIHPRAEIRDDRNVFVARAMLKDSEMLLRPGMRGIGAISSDSHPLGWNLFHKAYHRLIAIIGV